MTCVCMNICMLRYRGMRVTVENEKTPNCNYWEPRKIRFGCWYPARLHGSYYQFQIPLAMHLQTANASPWITSYVYKY